MRGNLARVLDVLEQKRELLEGDAVGMAEKLLAGKEKLLAKIDALTASVPEGAIKTRVHGDYHLGQVLIAEADVVILDFEGEPARPLAERRERNSALRDVAGMLRSFNYARWTAFRAAVRGHEDDERLAPLALEWETQVRRAFLAAYDEGTRDNEAMPALAAVRGLLELFELEKALYELRYELANRPGWAAIPLQGILALSGIRSPDDASAQ